MILTCKNHPHLFWRCKDIAYSPEANDGKGGYNGARNIFFFGERRRLIEPANSSWKYTTYVTDDDRVDPCVRECECSSRDLIGAPGSEEG